MDREHSKQHSNSEPIANSDIRGLSGRVHSVLSRLQHLKAVVIASTAQSASTDGNISSVEVPSLRHEINEARERILHLKSTLCGAPPKLDILEGVAPVPLPRKQVDDTSKPLIERIGGEVVLEALVGFLYAKLMIDTRLRAFFEQTPRKMASIKQRLFQFLLGYLGGKSTYDETNLKPAHYHLNVTDYHFDAFLDILQSAMENDIKVHPQATRDVLVSLSKVRKEIITGYTIRCELARINTKQGMEVLFNKLGGLDGVVRFVDRLYDVIAADTRISRFFTGKNFETIKHGQLAYITALIGGPHLYRRGPLEEIHKNLAIDDYFFDCYLQDAEKALHWLDIDDSVSDQVLIQLESVRPAVLGRSRGVAQIISSPADLVPVQLPTAVTSPNDSFRSPGADTPTTASLMAQLGGELNVEGIVETVYNGSLCDPRLRYFYLGVKIRQETFKRAFFNCIVTVAGGPVMYDLTQLRAIHFDMNITDYHFDTLMINLADACRLMEVKPGPTKELVTRMSKLRSEITGGCTIRLEMAQQRTESSGSVSPMSGSLDGPEGINRVITKLYEFVLQDERILHFFQGSKMEPLVKLQGQFLANLFGAGELYTGRDIGKVHALLNVADFHFDCFLENISKAVQACGFSTDTADECTVLVETTRRTIVNPASRNYSMTSQKNLTEALGGTDGIARSVDQVVKAAMKDGGPLRFTLESNSQHIPAIKDRMVKFVQQVSSCRSSGDWIDRAFIGRELARSLADVDVTDRRFDAIVSIVESTLVELKHILPEQIDDFVDICRSYRGQATKGYRLRQEELSLAFRESMTDDDSLFARIGNEQGLRSLIATYLRNVKDDEVIGAVFTSDHAVPLIRLVSRMVQCGKATEDDMGSRILCLNHYQFDRFVSGMKDTMSDQLHLQSTVVVEMASCVLEPLRPLLTTGEPLKRTTTLFDQYGGETGIEQLIDVTMEKLLAHDIKVFFDIPKSRMRTFKRRLARFVSALFSGPGVVLPNGEYSSHSTHPYASNMSGGSGKSTGQTVGTGGMNYLRHVHWNMNITDSHFDAFVECMRAAAKELGASLEVKRDTEALLNSVRGDIVIGWAKRSHDSEVRSRSVDGESIYERMGGNSTDPGLEAFLARFYELIERDRRINEFFIGAKFNAIRHAQGRFIVSILGGPVVTTRFLAEVHRIFNINNYHFDCFTKNALSAARDSGAPADVIDDIAVVFEPFREAIIAGSRRNDFQQ